MKESGTYKDTLHSALCACSCPSHPNSGHVPLADVDGPRRLLARLAHGRHSQPCPKLHYRHVRVLVNKLCACDGTRVIGSGPVRCTVLRRLLRSFPDDVSCVQPWFEMMHARVPYAVLSLSFSHGNRTHLSRTPQSARAARLCGARSRTSPQT